MGASVAIPQPQTDHQQAVRQSHHEQSTPSLELPLTFERHVGDLDEMLKRHEIRVLVVPSRSGFFYGAGRPQGIFYEAFNEFQRFANQKYKTGSLKINVTYLPMWPDHRHIVRKLVDATLARKRERLNLY